MVSLCRSGWAAERIQQRNKDEGVLACKVKRWRKGAKQIGREGKRRRQSVHDLANRGQYHSAAGSQRGGGGDEVRIAQLDVRQREGWW